MAVFGRSQLTGASCRAGDVQRLLPYWYFLFHAMPLSVSWELQVIGHKLYLMIPLKAVCCAPVENQTVLQATQHIQNVMDLLKMCLTLFEAACNYISRE